ncbi:hypothetical protein A1O3_01754 [Capronia epimyces CBS 606.96]|uniref:peptidylprolyl isomerase n=1 Tax=Capronia epimyces CBS 606.96 TaxID=1182542 RepID=W9YJW3_9EURO|nr:uncharacterized protein A1O3_01754 [Capronia epimyces CBS 606.96]EXJ93197.1 hypothetical protein A1O3_01754 [Capronia epimyces CBS 606.96]
MSGTQPVAVYAMKVPPGDIMVPAVPEFAAMFRVTMAAIDPSAEPEFEDADDKRPARATLKVVRVPDHLFDDSDEDSEDDEDYLNGLEDDESSSDDDEEANGGPSDRKSTKLALLEALANEEAEDEDMEDNEDNDEEDDDEADERAIAQLKALMKASKGKGKALDGDEDDDDEEDSEDEAVELDEVVVCTLDPEKNYQQTLDFVVGEGEKVFFKVSGTHTIHLTGNYVIPQDDGQASLYDEDDEDEDDYDLSPDEDELDAFEDSDEESDELDDLADPRVTEVDSEDEKAAASTKNVSKGKNKRPAEDSDDEEDEEANLDDIMAKSLKKGEAAANGEEKKLSKAEKKRLKKLKKNDGEAAPAGTTAAEAGKKEGAQANGSSEKKVQFAKNLEQGPTPSGTSTAKADKKTEKAGASTGVKEVNGVSIDVRKVGTGPAAKKGNRLEMRYIGKLDNGKVFDSNKAGKPFSFKLGAGEVIKGWDIGLEGIQVGGERRLVIPPNLAYGSKALPGIPKNSKLTFDIKCLSVK